MILRSSITKTATCPLCEKTVVPSRGLPKEGDWIICGGCKTVLLFARVAPYISYTLPTESELREIRESRDYLAVLARYAK